LLDIQSRLVTDIVLCVPFGCLGITRIVQVSLAGLHSFEKHRLLGRTLLNDAFAIFGEIVRLVDEPVPNMRRRVTGIYEEFLLDFRVDQSTSCRIDVRFP
jgi:hypothetical protein